MFQNRIILVILAWALLSISSGLAQNKYVGAKFCGACHKSGKGGTAYAVWEKSKHAMAFKTLQGEDAIKMAKEKGLKTAPAESPECLKCHVTGGGAAKNVEATFKKEEGVTCEACHGAASGFKMIHAKGDLEKSIAAGMVKPGKDGKSCETCHNAESPTHKEFKFAEMWAKIEHGKPAKK